MERGGKMPTGTSKERGSEPGWKDMGRGCCCGAQTGRSGLLASRSNEGEGALNSVTTQKASEKDSLKVPREEKSCGEETSQHVPREEKH